MNNEFPEPGEEITRLVREIEALRGDMQMALGKLAQMEKRLRAVFPNLPKKPKPLREEQRQQSLKSEEQLQEDFQRILKAVEESGQQGFESAISAMPQEDVIALAAELGIGQLKRTSLPKAIDGIRKRVQERRMLGPTRHERG
jgi:molybdopterin-biosynthesis enzyme MoeA-like protein